MLNRHFILLLVMLSSTTLIFGQKEDSLNNLSNFDMEALTETMFRRNIDPRQYIKIFTINKLDKKELVWAYNRDDRNGNQVLKIVDASSNIQIEFDKSEIAKNPLFKGNISIEGKIVSSKGGEDPVEVYPYSRIGKETRKVGITSRPPNEIAKIFVNLLLEALDATNVDNDFSVNSIDIETFNTDLKSLINEINKLPPNESYFQNLAKSADISNDALFSKLDRLIFKLNSFGFSSERLPNGVYGARELKAIKNAELSQELDDFSEVITNFFEQKNNKKGKDLPEKISQLNSRIKIIIEYINYFKSSGEKAEDAFLSLIQLDHIALDNIESKLTNINNEINLFFNQQSANAVISSKNNGGFQIKNTNNISITNDIQSTYIDGIEEIKKLTRLRGSEIENLLFPFSIYSDSEDLSRKYYDALLFQRKDVIKSLATTASEIIYLNLDYATINLKKERGQEGDYLYIYAVLEQSSRRSNGEKGEIVQKVLPMGSYELRKTGWQVNVADSFLLVNRIDEPNSEENTDVSPSNFKGAPGVSLLLTHRRTNDKNTVVNFLEPSIGVNVSYMDFSRNDDVEIGAGIVIGLFNNKLFFSGGLNLNSTAQTESDPYYFGVGFSFANLAAKLLEK